MRDWELLRLLNDVTFQGAAGAPEHGMTTAECAATADRLGTAFESDLSEHAPALRRPVCWPEMLFVPTSSGSSGARTITENATAGTG